MKKQKRRLLRILKWSVICVLSYWFVTTLIFGHTNLDSRTGMISFRWSGIDAIFSTDEEFGFFIDEQYKTYLNGFDGPYVFNDTSFFVSNENQLVVESFDRNAPLNVDVNNNDKDNFKVILRKSYKRETEYYELPRRLIAISDIEGNFNALYGFLINNEVIDENYNWLFNDGHLVLNGDFFDRGKNVNQVLWLVYKLEIEAEKHDGKVHFINGNHEIMNLYGDASYSDMRYIEVAKQISNKKEWNTAMKYLYSEKSELGQWLRSKNVIEKIGGYIFVHGGLNKAHIEANLSISEINETAIEYYGERPKRDSLSTSQKLVLSSYSSPYWNRSLSMNLMYQTIFFLNGGPTHKTTEQELEEVLSYYDAKKIVIGHSVVSNVMSDYAGKVIKIDVKHGMEKNCSSTQGFLLENGIEYKVDGLGRKEEL